MREIIPIRVWKCNRLTDFYSIFRTFLNKIASKIDWQVCNCLVSPPSPRTPSPFLRPPPWTTMEALPWDSRHPMVRLKTRSIKMWHQSLGVEIAEVESWHQKKRVWKPKLSVFNTVVESNIGLLCPSSVLYNFWKCVAFALSVFGNT